MKNNLIVITGVVILLAAGVWWLMTQTPQMTDVPPGDLYNSPKAPNIPAAMKTWKRSVDPNLDVVFTPQSLAARVNTLAKDFYGMSLPDKADLKGFAEKDGVLYFADYANRCVWAFDKATKKRTKFADGFTVPSPYFGIAAGKDYIWIVNPGEHRVQPNWPNGDLDREKIWGTFGAGLAAFPGCCNPTFLGVLSDGRIVTAQKGIPMVKVYNEKGELDSVVAGPEEFPSAKSITGLAVQGDKINVWVESNGNSEVRLYVPKESSND